MSSHKRLIEVKADQESLHLPPPAKSAQTVPLPAVVDFDKFWDALVEELKAVDKGPNVNSSELLELADGHYVIRSELKGDDEKPFIQKRAFKFDKSKCEVREDIRRFPRLNLLQWRGLIKVHKDPLRVEYMRQLVPSGSRRAGRGVAAALTLILNRALNRTVEVTADQPSPTNPDRKSAVSEPLDDFTSRDGLYDAMCEAVKVRPHAFCKTVSEVVKEACPEPAGVAFTVKFTLDGKRMKEARPEMQQALADTFGAGVQEGTDIEVELSVLANRAGGSFALLQSLPDGRALTITYLRISADPLRVESFRQPLGAPVGGDGAREATAYTVSKCLLRLKRG